MLASILIFGQQQVVAQTESTDNTPRVASGSLLQFALDGQFVPVADEKDYESDVLAPLKESQAKIAEAARVEAERLAKLKSDCDGRGGTLDGEQCNLPKPVVKAATQSVGSLSAAAANISSSASSRSVATGNNYAYGYCTWYVANRVAVPSSMGNATNWSYGLAAAGWSRTLAPGSVGVSHLGAAGHVVYAELVTPLGVLVSEMNYSGGWNIVNQRLVSASSFEWFHN